MMTHFTHEHPLGVVSYDDDFTCDGCHTLGAGKRYHCQRCRFNLHKECAESPTNKSSHLHRMDHQLNRVWDNPEDTAAFSGHRPCNVCEDEVNGLYFACPVLSCNFVLHPICSNVPPSVRHVTDREHPLTFQSAMESECRNCRRNCTGWRYRCGPCRIDIHLECLLSPLPAINLHDDSLIRSRSVGQSMNKSLPTLDHQNYSPQAAGINSVGMQSSSSSSPLFYGLHHSHYCNCSQYIPFNRPAGGYGSAAGGYGSPSSPSSPSYGNGTLSQHQPFYNNHGPHNSDGSGHLGSPGGSQSGHLGSPGGSQSGHLGSPGGSQSGGKKKRMYVIVGELVAMVAGQTIAGLIGGVI